MTTSIYDYKPEHFGDTILEGVIVRDVHTFAGVHEWDGWLGWCWRLDQKPGLRFAGPYPPKRVLPWEEIEPPSRAQVVADIQRWIREAMKMGELRMDAFEAA